MLSTAPIRAYIPATDVARARKLYEEKIGMRPKEEYAGGVIYECGGAEVFLYGTKNAGTSKASQAYWQVEDVEAEVAELKRRGVKFEEYDMPGEPMKNSISNHGGAKTAWFTRPPKADPPAVGNTVRSTAVTHRGKHPRSQPAALGRPLTLPLPPQAGGEEDCSVRRASRRRS